MRRLQNKSNQKKQKGRSFKMDLHAILKLRLMRGIMLPEADRR